MDVKYIDTHAHLNLATFKEDALDVASRCAKEGVAVINVGTSEASSRRAVELAQEADNCFAIIGLHPIYTIPGRVDEDSPQPKTEEFNPDFYRELAKAPKVVGVGECGFDYYRMSEGSGSSLSAHMTERMEVESGAQWHTASDSYEIQERNFIAQIKFANEHNLPLMIHTRNPKPGAESPTGRSVYEDVYQVLKQYAKVPFNIHFYAGTTAEAARFFELGGTISFTGVITFAKDYEEVVKNAPLELIHGETDCPYVAPVPHRGKRAEPWMVQEVYKKIATIKEMDEEEVRVQLVENAKRLYRVG